ncbi:MAG TPA: DNA-formamidopyrimidine glycosylase family protein [Kiritimatiellia bacterium]|nr:DNA-formamidopyrimidine glycosylase family protein [Kiritimatiellia bacterium]HMO99864.1 DNA-formamidopyrimidine glycosylase family protein [Kiritimatiellia bacterium]HMP96376.1 DNA-formamidopyrimidine glycosylase family protein [Kiritimatiellia bacterium]
MPELPEVETARREVEQAAKGKVIRRVFTVDDAIVYDGVAPRAVARALTDRKITGLERRGKHLWVMLDRRPWPMFHFGMTGWLHVYRQEAERPRFWKIELVLDDGTRIGFRDPRRLGRIRLRHDPRTEPPVSLLGFDPLHDLPGPAVFIKEFSRRKAPVKAVLLDQSFSAGVGNWIADEVLYQSGIDPRRRSDTLRPADVRRVRSKLTAIVKHAVHVGADDSKFPRTWLFHYRWGKTKGATDGRGRAIRFGTVGGRTTAWVPDVQPE